MCLMDLRVISRKDRELVLEIRGEDHTLGNLLMKEALKHPSVEYAAYRIPHPLRDVMEFTLIVKEGADVSRVLREVIDALRSEVSEFKKSVESVLGQD